MSNKCLAFTHECLRGVSTIISVVSLGASIFLLTVVNLGTVEPNTLTGLNILGSLMLISSVVYLALELVTYNMPKTYSLDGQPVIVL